MGAGGAGVGRHAGLASRHRSSVGLRWPSKRIAALHRLPIRSVWAARCALRCAPMAARSLRHLIRDATLAMIGPVQRKARPFAGIIQRHAAGHSMLPCAAHPRATAPCPSTAMRVSTLDSSKGHP
ncbi:hypothetical protein [Verminephrobacter eiseniae]|uniref:hypothetical protein n=1 Tax=Verminephrobacter eiseniae TaxID=364317 RepID=UPI0022382981|nr:hypothetical protein [Verminephrobacter eiseniae]